MNKNEFIRELKEKLKRLPSSEIDSAVSYYEEYFNEAGQENEQNILAQLDSPSAVASKIIGEYAINTAEEPKEKNSQKTLWIVLLAIFASPIALPLALAVVIVAIALLVSLFAIFLSFCLVGSLLAGGGVLFIVCSVLIMFSSFPTFIFFLGCGLVAIALGIAFVRGITKLFKITFSGIQKMLGKFLAKRGTK